MSDKKIQAWIRKANRLALKQQELSLDTWEALATRLAQLDRLMRSAPPKLLGSYIRCPESALGRRAERRIALLEMGGGAWSVAWQDDPLHVILPLAVEIRAVDELLRRLRPREMPANPNKAWRTNGSPSVFVVPVRGPGAGRVGDRQPYMRRGVLRHRILPGRIGDYRIRLAVVAGGVGAAVPERIFQGGAAFFQGLEFEYAGVTKERFTVTKSEAPDQSAQINAHLEAAHAAGCTALVWPELTLKPQNRKQVKAWLATRLLRLEGSLAALDFVVAGTWHETRRGKTWNVGTVFDGFGVPLARFLKNQAFHDASIGTEDIQEGGEITVLVLEDRLVGFGICKDFCDAYDTNPYPKLDLDLYVVPSMGNAATMEGHIHTAQTLRTRFGARSFVVQQAEPELDGLLGFVVPPNDKLTGFTAKDAALKARFGAYPAG